MTLADYARLILAGVAFVAIYALVNWAAGRRDADRKAGRTFRFWPYASVLLVGFSFWVALFTFLFKIVA